jgi:hypothetical protein
VMMEGEFIQMFGHLFVSWKKKHSIKK